MRTLIDRLRALHRWLLPRELPQDQRERSRVNLLVGTILAYLIVLGIALPPFFIMVDVPNATMMLLRVTCLGAILFSMAFVLGLLRVTGRRKLAANLFVAMISLVFVGTTIATGGDDSPLLAIYVVVPTTATVLSGRRDGLLWAGGTVLNIVALHVAGHTGYEFPQLSTPEALTTASSLISVLLFVIVIAALQVYDYMADQLSQTLDDERKHYAYLALFDPLTKVANRIVFSARIREAIARTDRTKHPFALVYIDLDDFKLINDRLGHTVGDAVLKTIGARLADHTRENDLVARLGGDEFGLVLEGISSDAEVATVASKILEDVMAPIRFGPTEIGVGASLGFALHPEYGEDLETLESMADHAMYSAKQEGGTYRIYRGEPLDDGLCSAVSEIDGTSLLAPESR